MTQGQPRFITAAGFARLRAEYEELFAVRAAEAGRNDLPGRPPMATGPRTATTSTAARSCERSTGGSDYLAKIMKAAKVVEPGAQGSRDQVRFGATVELADEDDARRTLTIVGDDEADASAGRIGWSAPIAKALIGAKVGDERIVRLPAGEKSYEVMEIRYPDA